MALTAGSRLGPYEVTAQIGAGGMGEVYPATNTNLGREGEIIVVPAMTPHWMKETKNIQYYVPNIQK